MRRQHDAVVRPLNEEDLPAALDLIYAQWSDSPRSCPEQMGRCDPWRGEGRSFGAFIGERLVAHARFHFRPVRIGRATLRMVGACCVVTHPEFRKRGLGHTVLRRALEWMQESGQHFCMLYTGVHSFYAALGWGNTTQPMYYLSPSAVPRLGHSKYRITQIPVAETPPEFAHIYDQTCGQHPISLARTHRYWRSWPRWAEDNVWFGLLDNVWNVAWEGDQIVAYGGIQRSIFEEGAIGIVEACALPDRADALWDLLDVLVARCRKAGGRSIELNLPCDHPITTRLAPLGERRADHSAMVRVVDLPRLLDALRPELEARSAHLPGPVRVRLDSPVGSAALSADRGTVTLDESSEAARAELSPAGLGSLLLGFRSAGELAEAGEIQASSTIIEQLALLFPCLHSHYWQIDHF